LTPIDRITSTK